MDQNHLKKWEKYMETLNSIISGIRHNENLKKLLDRLLEEEKKNG